MVKTENPYAYHRRISEYAKRSPSAQFFSGRDSAGSAETDVQGLESLDGDSHFAAGAPVPQQQQQQQQQQHEAEDGKRTTIARTLTRGPEELSGLGESNASLWDVPCDFAFPCAGEMELTETKARKLIEGGCQGVFEGANIPSTPEAVAVFSEEARRSEGKFVHAPSKACNAGGMAVSAMQVMDPLRPVNEEQVEAVMAAIYEDCANVARTFSPGDLNAGANIASLMRVANAMVEEGSV